VIQEDNDVFSIDFSAGMKPVIAFSRHDDACCDGLSEARLGDFYFGAGATVLPNLLRFGWQLR